MNRFLLAASLLLGSLSPALAQRVVTQKASLGAGQRVQLQLKNASTVRVRPGNEFRIQVRVNLNDNQQNDAYQLVVEPTADVLLVSEKLDLNQLRQANWQGTCAGTTYNNGGGNKDRDHGGYHYCANLDYDISLPASTEISVNTISGEVDVQGLSGVVILNTVSGNVNLDNIRGPLTAKSVSGYVKLTRVGTQAVTAKSVSGDIDLSWPPAQAASLSLHTVTGEVYADPAVTFDNVKEHSYVGYQLHGTFGSGSGPLVKLESVSGDVFFRKQP
jgi:hypothetical protein